ncbi:hypothetical protein D3C87_1719010 [compost metagenome]
MCLLLNTVYNFLKRKWPCAFHEHERIRERMEGKCFEKTVGIFVKLLFGNIEQRCLAADLPSDADQPVDSLFA